MQNREGIPATLAGKKREESEVLRADLRFVLGELSQRMSSEEFANMTTALESKDGKRVAVKTSEKAINSGMANLEVTGEKCRSQGIAFRGQ